MGHLSCVDLLALSRVNKKFFKVYQYYRMRIRIRCERCDRYECVGADISVVNKDPYYVWSNLQPVHCAKLPRSDRFVCGDCANDLQCTFCHEFVNRFKDENDILWSCKCCRINRSAKWTTCCHDCATQFTNANKPIKCPIDKTVKFERHPDIYDAFCREHCLTVTPHYFMDNLEYCSLCEIPYTG